MPSLTTKKQPPQPFEIALIRKIESKTSSVRKAFLLLDIDGDGRISPSDVRTVLHNELGLDITKEQEEILASRLRPQNNQSSSGDEENNNGGAIGMGYGDFARYFHEVSSSSFPASQSGLAAAVGFHRDDDPNNGGIDREKSIHLQPETIVHQKRQQLRQLLRSHSSREGQGAMGMKGTSLFLAMDVNRSAKVAMEEFLDWLNKIGMLEWTIEDLKQVVLVGDKCNGNYEELETRWFGSIDCESHGEAGMTEHEFAEFVESLDSD